MAKDADDATYYSRSVDHLGMIGSELRDLSRYASLARELIQNAEDAPASSMAFRIEQDALLIDNDGTFTDCGHLESPECPWVEDDQHGLRCDFHRIRYIAGSDKRYQQGTVGSFGLGFISVYQVTDKPEIISAGHHWIIDEAAEEGRRIRECTDCPLCRHPALPNTRLRLPWALDPASEMRTRLRAEAVGQADRALLRRELTDALPDAMLFLRNIKRIEVFVEGRLVQRLERERDGQTILLADGASDRVWHLLSGNFAAEAEEIRARYPGKIEEKRTAEVQIAMPADLGTEGVLCAFLPTQHSTGFPFHIQADFFPTSDRKQVVFGSGYAAEWNRAAIRGAARCLSSASSLLKREFSPVDVWKLIAAVHRAHAERGKMDKDEVLGEFWSSMVPILRDEPMVWTSSGNWLNAKTAFLLEREEEEERLPMMEMLGIPIVDHSLRTYFAILRASEVGVPLLDVPELVAAVERKGITGEVHADNLPSEFQQAAFLQMLWAEFAQLLQRKRKPEADREMRQLVEQCPVVPCRDGVWRPAEDTYWSDEETEELFESLGLGCHFADHVEGLDKTLKQHCVAFDVRLAIDELRDVVDSSAWPAKQSADVALLLSWFEERRATVNSDAAAKRGLASLPIFPTTGGSRPLAELSFPGDFSDPLGIAHLVDMGALEGRRDFLRELGARELTISQYAAVHLPTALREGTISSDRVRSVVELLAQRLGELRESADAHRELSQLRIVECADQVWRVPGEAYIESPSTRRVLGEIGELAVIPREHTQTIKEFLLWLGVAETPRTDDVLARIDETVVEPPDISRVEVVRACVDYLANRQRIGELTEADLNSLKSRAWLPAEGREHGWYRPGEIYTNFRKHLFETQATFLALSAAIEQDAAPFLRELGVRSEPDVAQVVSHLLACVRESVAVNVQVYGFLNGAVSDDANLLTIARIRGKAFIHAGAGRYLSADRVLWSDHPFARWRTKLGSELRTYQKLFDFLGVRDGPDARMAIEVLREVESEYGPANRTLDAEAVEVVLACWRLIESSAGATVHDAGSENLRTLANSKVIPGPQSTLNAPSSMFFEDRSGFSLRFPRLKYNLIPRYEGAWRAMEAAGVRSLISSARVELLECEDEAPDHELHTRIWERRGEIARVFETGASREGDRETLEARLSRITCRRVSRLTLRFAITAFGKDQTSEPEEALALYESHSHTLFRSGGDSERTSIAIARELSLGIEPDGDRAGMLASGIREVLSATTNDEAREILDELGFPKAQVATEGRATVEHLDSLGISGEVPSGPLTSNGTNLAPTNNEREKSNAASRQSEPERPANDARDGVSGQGAGVQHEGSSTDTAYGLGSSSTGHSASAEESPSDGPGRDRARRPQAKLRSYVSAGGGATERGGNEADADDRRRREIDTAGVKAVLYFETANGRLPVEMPHNNPGFDVQSRDDDGNVVRFIEIKSTDGDWGERGVALSSVQFARARDLGPQYWLYVVTHARSSHPDIARIQDPYSKVTEFVFDNGWRAVVEG